MFGKALLTFAAALGIAAAQTAPGFPLPATQSLVVRFGNNTVSPAGELIPRPGMSPLDDWQLNISKIRFRDCQPSQHQHTSLVGISRQWEPYTTWCPADGRPGRPTQQQPSPACALDSRERDSWIRCVYLQLDTSRHSQRTSALPAAISSCR